MNTWDKITEFEEGVRDSLFAPVVRLIPGWVKPNHITSMRLCLVVIAVVLYLFNYPINVQVWTLVAAALTDTLDGILARTRDQKTTFGAYLDHVCDWVLGIWTGVLALINGLLPKTFIVLIVIPEVAIMILDRIRASRINEGNLSKRVITITMGPANFHPSILTRSQFFVLLFGLFLLLLSNVWNSAFLQSIGYVSLYAAVCLAWFVLIESYRRLFGDEPVGPTRSKLEL